MQYWLGIDVASRAAHQASLADESGRFLWSGHRFRTEAEDLERLWAMLPERGADTEVLVLLEPTRNAWVPLAAWFRRRGARVVLVPPERSSDLRDYYHKHTKSDRLDSRLLARLPLLHPEGLHDEHGLGPATRCDVRPGCARAWCGAARSRWRGSMRYWSCSGRSGWRPSASASPTRLRCASSPPVTPAPTP